MRWSRRGPLGASARAKVNGIHLPAWGEAGHIVKTRSRVRLGFRGGGSMVQRRKRLIDVDAILDASLACVDDSGRLTMTDLAGRLGDQPVGGLQAPQRPRGDHRGTARTGRRRRHADAAAGRQRLDRPGQRVDALLPRCPGAPPAPDPPAHGDHHDQRLGAARLRPGRSTPPRSRGCRPARYSSWISVLDSYALGDGARPGRPRGRVAGRGRRPPGPGRGARRRRRRDSSAPTRPSTSASLRCWTGCGVVGRLKRQPPRTASTLAHRSDAETCQAPVMVRKDRRLRR